MQPDGNHWITKQQAARILDIGECGIRSLVARKHLTNYATGARPSCFSRQEVEALARDPARLRRKANAARSLAGRRLPDPAYTPARLISQEEAISLLAVKETVLYYLITSGQLVTYQLQPGRSPHRFDPDEVITLRDRRAEQRDTRRAKQQNACPRKKVHWLASTKRVEVGQLSVHEHYFGDWLTARQVAWMLHIGMPQVYRLRDQGRLSAQRLPAFWYGGLRWQFPKAEVLALMNDRAYFLRRACYENHCTPEARARKQEEESLRQLEITARIMRENTDTRPLQEWLDTCW